MLTFDVAGEAVVIDPEVVIVAGYTGRDGAAVQRHIEELADEGVPAPASVPTYLALPPAAVAQADGITTIHAETSGEAEIALVVDGGRRFVTLASDHTDRRAETFDMAIAKFACPKLLASRAWPYEVVAGHWDQLCLRSWVDDGSGRTVARPALAGGAYATILSDAARDAAGPGGRPDGPLARSIVAVKDLIAVRGVPLRAGARLRSDTPPEPRDATVVARVRAAGAVIVGTTTLHEFAFGVTGVNEECGTPVNPAAPGAAPGGSSSGSAVAVAEGSATLALGTDTGGSVRIPASLCGVIGFKPRIGTYPTDGVLPLAPSLDHVGLLARSLDELGLAHRVLAPREWEERPRIGVVGFDPDELARSDDAVMKAVDRVLRLLDRAGCELREVRLPPASDVFEASTVILLAEAAATHGAGSGDLEGYGADVAARLATGAGIPATTYVGALRRQAEIVRAMVELLQSVEFLVGPTTLTTAPDLASAHAPEVAAKLVATTRLANLAGHPALSLPAPADGPPVGVQVQAADNPSVLAAARLVTLLPPD
ncbi:MAG: DUF2848 family protein [Actinobacteria bacterium]|nr:DUF2848 family protein [Actinomycetota bacterium]